MSFDKPPKKTYEELREILKELETKETQVNKEVFKLWPSRTPEEIKEDPLFYEKPITQPHSMTQEEFLGSLKEKKVPQEIIDVLVLVNVDYRGFDSKTYEGQIIIHEDLESSITKVFQRILSETDFPMTSVSPLSMFNWNSSSKNNNSGAFDPRLVSNSDEISDHTFGAAIDINPLLNPWVQKGLENPSYDLSKRGTLDEYSAVVKIFEEEGWKWGGNWENSKDWQHFYRPEIGRKYYNKEEVKE